MTPAEECELQAVLESRSPDGVRYGAQYDVIFTNVGSVECEFQGYPDVLFFDSAGDEVSQVVFQENTGRSTLEAFSIAPGEHAYVLMDIYTAGKTGSPCALINANTMRLQIPASGQSFDLDVAALDVCDREPGVDPFAPERVPNDYLS